MKYFKWFFIIAVCFIAFIMLAEAEDHTKQTWTIVGFIAWLYWLLKESIEEKSLAIHRRLDYIQTLLEKSRE